MDKAKAISWMDRMIFCLEMMQATERMVGEYRSIETMGRKSFQMSDETFNNLLHDTGMVATYNPNWAEKIPQTGEEYIMYKGYRFYALWDKKGDKT